MKLSLFLQSLLCALTLSVAPASAASCNADNCARALTGTRNSPLTQSARQSECSSYMLCTYTPATATSTFTATVPSSIVTTTVTPTTPGAPAGKVRRDLGLGGYVPMNKRGGDEHIEAKRAATTSAAGGAVVQCPTAVPSWAQQSCSGNPQSRYASACACAGVAYSTSTLSAQSVVVTITSTGGVYTRTVTAAPGFC